MLAVAKAEHVDIVHFDGAARRRNVPNGTAEDAVLSAHECAFFTYDIDDDVSGMPRTAWGRTPPVRLFAGRVLTSGQAPAAGPIIGRGAWLPPGGGALRCFPNRNRPVS